MKNSRTVRTINRHNGGNVGFTGVIAPCGKSVVRLLKQNRKVLRVLKNVGNGIYVDTFAAYGGVQTHKQILNSLSKWGV